MSEMDIHTLRDIDRQISNLRLFVERRLSDSHLSAQLAQQENITLRAQIISRLDKIEAKLNAATPRPPWVIDLSGLPWLKLIVVLLLFSTQLPGADLASLVKLVNVLFAGSTGR